MRTRLRTKARIESETNRFIAAPLEIYSPSSRLSISSDDQTNFANANIVTSVSDTDDDEMMGETGENSRNLTDEMDREFNASMYGSIRQRLMENAIAHLSTDAQRDTANTYIDIRNAWRVTSEQENTSNFSSSWATDKNEVVKKYRNKKTLDKPFTGIPRVGGMYMRIKGDKCLACMRQSLGDVNHRPTRKVAGALLNDKILDDLILNDNERTSTIRNIAFSTVTSLEQCYKDRYRDSLLVDKTLEKLMTEHHSATSLFAESPNDRDRAMGVKNSGTSFEEFGNDPSKTVSSINDPRRTRLVVKSASTAVIAAKALITSLMSQRSKSVSDQDDSDQGSVDPVVNKGGSISKNLAPCHMPINLKPSLAPLKALRSKTSRSIRSRVASAEKSGDSANDDDSNSDHENNIGRQPLNEVKNKPIAMGSPTSEKLGGCGMKQDRDFATGKLINAARAQSVVEVEGIIASKTDIGNDVKTNLFDNSTIISDDEVVEILKKCVENDMTITESFRVLANEYSNRLSRSLSRQNCSPRFKNFRRNETKVINLVALLAEFKNHLNRGKRVHNVSDPAPPPDQPNLSNSRQLRRILPLKSYNLVAPILGMAEWYPTRQKSNLRAPSKRVSQRDTQEKSREDAFDLIAVTWRPLTARDLQGYDPEATLKKRAAKITDKICEDFCHWLESLGTGTHHMSSIDAEVLKDIFETDFTAEVCSTMELSIKEMPMVPTAVAIARNCPEASELPLTRKLLATDAKAEMRSKRTVGLGTSLSGDLRFVPPQNQVDKKWLQCKNVPKELETMETVWKGITHLDSVKGFVKWFKANPQVKRPKGLETVFVSRQTAGSRKSVVNDFKHLELELDQIQSLKVAEDASNSH